MHMGILKVRFRCCCLFCLSVSFALLWFVVCLFDFLSFFLFFKYEFFKFDIYLFAFKLPFVSHPIADFSFF